MLPWCRGGGPAVLSAGLSLPLSLDPEASAFPSVSPWVLPQETPPDLEGEWFPGEWGLPGLQPAPQPGSSGVSSKPITAHRPRANPLAMPSGT